MPAIFKTKLPNYPSPPTPSPSLLGEGENTIYNFRMTKMDSMVKARYLRREETKVEKILWKELRNRKLGVKFRRQHPVGKFILDFYASEIKLGIELDGSSHKESLDDKFRTEYLKSQGIKIIRFWNSEVERNLGKVLEKIKEMVSPLSSKVGEGLG